MEIKNIEELDAAAILSLLYERAREWEALSKSEEDVSPIIRLQEDIKSMRKQIEEEKIQSVRKYFAMG